MVNKADQDLREIGPDPVPWRRVYGFAQNGHMLDRGFLFCSTAVLLVWVLRSPNISNFALLLNGFVFNWLFLGYLGVGALFASGETDRRDRTPRLAFLKPVRWPLLILGTGLFFSWVALSWLSILRNIDGVLTDPLAVLLYVSAVVLAAVAAVLWERSRGGQANV